MLPTILQIDPAVARYPRDSLTPQALADVIAEALPQALAQFDAGIGHAALVPCGDLVGLHPHQVLTLQIATLERFLGVQEATND